MCDCTDEGTPWTTVTTHVPSNTCTGCASHCMLASYIQSGDQHSLHCRAQSIAADVDATITCTTLFLYVRTSMPVSRQYRFSFRQ